jgi:hypothetical protein
VKKVLAVALVLAIVTAAGAGCGKDGVVGTYKYGSGDESLKLLTLIVRGDRTFELIGTHPVTGQVARLTGTYTLDGTRITLTAPGVLDGESGEYDRGELVFQDVVWVKQ